MLNRLGTNRKNFDTPGGACFTGENPFFNFRKILAENPNQISHRSGHGRMLSGLSTAHPIHRQKSPVHSSSFMQNNAAGIITSATNGKLGITVGFS